MWECINDPSLDTNWSLQNVYKHVSFRNSTILLFPKRIQDLVKNSIISKIKNADIQSIWHILSLNEPLMFDDHQGGQEWNKGRVRSLWPASQGRRWDPDAAGKKTHKFKNTLGNSEKERFERKFLKTSSAGDSVWDKVGRDHHPGFQDEGWREQVGHLFCDEYKIFNPPCQKNCQNCTFLLPPDTTTTPLESYKRRSNSSTGPHFSKQRLGDSDRFFKVFDFKFFYLLYVYAATFSGKSIERSQRMRK